MSDHSRQGGAFDSCQTKDEAKTLLESLNVEPRTIIAANKKAFNVRCKEIRRVELIPYHEEAKRWKQGQKVYFGTGDNMSFMSFETMRITKDYDIKRGDWCFVWHYMPRAKILWLCYPGKKCEFKNVIRSSFSLGAIERCKISRTEIALRA